MSIWKIPKIFNFISEIPKISQILQLGQRSKFHKFPILLIIKYFRGSNNLKKYKNQK